MGVHLIFNDKLAQICKNSPPAALMTMYTLAFYYSLFECYHHLMILITDFYYAGSLHKEYKNHSSLKIFITKVRNLLLLCFGGNY